VRDSFTEVKMRPSRFACILIFLAAFVAVFVPLIPAIPFTSAHVSQHRSEHFILHGRDGVALAELERVGAAVEDVYASVLRLASFDSTLATISIHVFPSLESKGLSTGYTTVTHSFTARNEVFVAIESGYRGEIEREVAALLCRRALGRPALDSMEAGLAMQFSPNWRGRGYLHWAARLQAMPLEDDFTHILDNRGFHKRSDLVMNPLAGSLISYLLQVWGDDEFLQRYATWNPDSEERELVEAGWRLYLNSVDVTCANHALPAPGFQRGFCFAHEGYNVNDGYISQISDGAMAQLVSLGANAVSLTPFTYMRDPRRPAALPFSEGAGSENDESIIHSAATARRLGMTVMLKPHIWMRGSWPGEIEMNNSADWDEFFLHYSRWIRHYALLAEMYDIEILCLGVEMGKTTVGHEAAWQRLAGQIRNVYDGKLIYAANWGSEFESVDFWEAFDFIGINCYYPLSEKEDPSDTELREGVDRIVAGIADVADRYHRPVLITEVGFTSTERPWQQPHERRRGGKVDEDAQTRCYEAFFSGIAGTSQIAGTYWWKWPSYMSYGGENHSGFTPSGKRAEDVVRHWYGRVLAE